MMTMTDFLALPERSPKPRTSGITHVLDKGLGPSQVMEGLIKEIRESIDPGRLLFEAPAKKQQVAFIKHFGSDVNLGNIAPDEVISVETLRLGLRGDTLLHFH
jgi:phosphosulfolactate synthase